MANCVGTSISSALAALMLIAASSRASTFTTLHIFGGKPGDGSHPTGDLVITQGQLFGVTQAGGQGCGKLGCGTAFAVNPVTGAEQVLREFSNSVAGISNGIRPILGLAAYGYKLIGMTEAGGDGNGTLFKVIPDTGHVHIRGNLAPIGIYSTPLVKYRGGLYGGTSTGGTSASCTIEGGCGTVYRIDPRFFRSSILYSFAGNRDGTAPGGRLLVVGNFIYGTTDGGQQTDASTLFRINPRSGAHQVVHYFPSFEKGAGPTGDLAFDGNAIYGTTMFGGAGRACGPNRCGTIYRFDLATKNFTILHSFTGDDGDEPIGGLLLSGGMLYGTTPYGGPGGFGNIFQTDPATGAFTVLQSFSASSPGCSPTAGLVADSGGTLYGTMPNCANAGNGTVFALVP